MMKTLVEHACGHAEQHDIAGHDRKREFVARRRATKVCSSCSRIAWQADVDTTNAYYAELAREHGLPELAGTDKQVPWAVGLRGELLDQVDAYAPELRAMCRQHGRPYNELGREVIHEIVRRHTDASWWIEHRKQLPTVLIKEHRRGLKFSGDAGDTAKGLLLILDTVR